VQHAVAAALIKGHAGLDQFTDVCVNDPEVLKLRSKVEVLRDETFSTVAAAVEVTTSDGMVFKLEQQAARGSDANPLSDRDLEDKLRAAASLWNPRYDATPLIDAIWNVEASADVSKLVSLTAV
jgi:2-methylcitrate dehydratase PrpD